MKKIYLLLFFACLAFTKTQAASYTIAVASTSALTVYTPSTTTVSIGDIVTIQSNSAHAAAQIDQTTWNANGTATVSGGFGWKFADYTFTVTVAQTVYFICLNHASMGMKGAIYVIGTGINENPAMLQHTLVYPNPVASEINVKFTLTNNAKVSAKLFNINGQEVKNLLNESDLTAGDHNYKFELPSSISDGNYFIQFYTDGKKNFTERIVVAK